MRPSLIGLALLLVGFAACGSSSSGGGGSGGSAGSAGTPGSGGRGGSGGAGTGGVAGSGGGTGGGMGTGGSGGAAGDAGSGDVAVDSGPSGHLDECFAGLRALTSTSQTATKRSANGAYEVRLAIEVPPDTAGTSGTRPWKLVRLAVVTPQTRLCVKDETALATAYKASLHNCSDSLTVTSAGLNYKLTLPDTDPMRANTTLSITGEAAIPPVTLMTVTCTGSNGAACKSGGPCM
jgi:hypothetical protein